MTNSEALGKARRHLSRRDGVLRAVIRQIGDCTLQHDPEHFAVLVRAIVGQQISTKAAQSINSRLADLLRSRYEPRRLLRLTDEELRGAGVSRPKLLALRDLAEKCASGEVPLARFAEMDDEDVIKTLLPVRGIGRWTAEMFLIFSLGRLDVLPAGDYGLRTGLSKQYDLAELPKKDAMERLAEPWRPYRSVGTWYIWRSLGTVPQSGE